MPIKATTNAELNSWEQQRFQHRSDWVRTQGVPKYLAKTIKETTFLFQDLFI